MDHFVLVVVVIVVVAAVDAFSAEGFVSRQRKTQEIVFGRSVSIHETSKFKTQDVIAPTEETVKQATKPQRTKEKPHEYSRKTTKDEIRNIQIQRENELRKQHNNDKWNALFVSVPDRPIPTPFSCSTQQKLPVDFPPGCLLRLGPNGAAQSDGFMDGDGMVYCITFPPRNNQQDDSDDDEPSDHMFSSTYIETNGRKLEAATPGNKRYMGSLGVVPKGLPLLAALARNAFTFKTLHGQKDTCNTALAEHGGRVLALMEQSPPTEIEINKDGSVKTVESMARLNGAIPFSDPLTGGTFSAHGRTCPDTNERIHVSYNSAKPPYARVDVFDQAGWQLKESIAVDDMSCPVMLHDCEITQNYAVLLDFPLTIRPLRMLKDTFPVEYEPEHGARIGLMLRRDPVGGEQRLTWFDCEPGVVLHSIHAYETDDNKVVLRALRSQPKSSSSYLQQYTAAYLHEWVLDLSTQTTLEERCLNPDVPLEFPILEDRFVGCKKAPHGYAVTVSSIGSPLKVYKAPEEGCTFDGVAKFALSDDEEIGVESGSILRKFTLPIGWYAVTEPTTAPKVGSEGSYVLVIATNVPDKVPSWDDIAEKGALKSRLFVLDGDDLGLVWESDLPYHVPYGLHSSFLEWDKMKQ